MKSTSKEVEEFVQFCRDHKDCKDTKDYLKLLEEFQNEYSSDKSLWWYTRESFVYRMLNKALRAQNIDVLFTFRFFIRDLAQQLKVNQWSSTGSVYRGQSLSKDELKRLKQSVGKLISINSFLSTTIHRNIAVSFINNGPYFEKVLFQINFNSIIDATKPFVNITLISEFPQEGEILFMLGSIFQIHSIDCDENSIWIVQLNLCSDNDPVLKSIFHYLRQESQRCEIDLLAFGNVLNDMGEFEQAKNYYERCLKLLPPDDCMWRAYCYYLLGLIDTVNGKNEHALHLFEKSLDIRTQTLDPSDPSLADTYIAIARVHYINCNFDQALELYKRALAIFHRTFGEDDLTSAMTYTNMGVVCKAQRKYAEALDYHWKALAIRKKHLPSDHFRFGTSYNNIGEVYQGLAQYETAMKYYDLAFEVYKRSLPSKHIDIAILLVNKGLLYQKMDDIQKAHSFHRKALHTYCRRWSRENPDLIQIEHILSKDVKLSESLGTIWIKLFRPFKCIASLDPRTQYRETQSSHLLNKNI